MTPADFKRLKRLRRRVLQLIDSAKAAGSIRGRWIADRIEDSDDFVEALAAFNGPMTSDQLVLQLCVDLANGGYATHADTRTHTAEREGLDYSAYSVTAKGTALLSEAIPVDPLIEDLRIAT